MLKRYEANEIRNPKLLLQSSYPAGGRPDNFIVKLSGLGLGLGLRLGFGVRVRVWG